MYVNGSRRNEHYVQRIFHKRFLRSLISFGQAVSEENIFLICHSETIIACGGHVGYWIATKCAIFIEDIRLMFPIKFRAKRFERRIFKKKRPIKNKNCLWRPCLITDEDKMCNLYRGPSSIDASYQVSVHLGKWFYRKILKCEKLTDDGLQVMAKTHFAFGKLSYKSISSSTSAILPKKAKTYWVALIFCRSIYLSKVLIIVHIK